MSVGDDESAFLRGVRSDPRLISLTLISIVGTFGSNVVSPALPAIATAFGVSDATVGLVMTAYTLPQIALILLLGLLADGYGRRAVVLPALVVFGVAGTAVMLVNGFIGVFALRLLQGMVAGGIIPITITLVGDLYEGAAGATAQGIRLAGNALSSIVVPAVAGFLAAIAWQYPFALYLLAFPAAALGYRYLPETALETDGIGLRRELRGYFQALRVEVTDPVIALLLLGGFVQGLALYALLTFVPLFSVRALGATTFAAGIALAMRGVARVIIAPFTGQVLTIVSRKWAIVGSMLVSGAGIVLLPAAPTVLWVGVAVGLFGLGDAFFTPVHRDTVAQRASTEYRAGVVNGMVVLLQIGTTISPVLFGAVLAAAGFGPLFALAGATYVGYALVVLLSFPAVTAT